MDKFDQKIIEALRRDARQSVSAIAQQINLSRPSVSERIKKLEQSGVIRGYQVLLSESTKAQVSAYLEIQHSSERCRDIINVFHQIPEVKTCHGITGEMDLLVYVETESMQRLHEIREELDTNRQLKKIKTHVVMSKWITNDNVG
ncbi:Lrp/AsnC family transcriptional regulator [Psychrobium sp. 1_MG-2023]|uniref:Lrp/AsnC family transcriptional regulator n=1 Tax=Psychrobium sp. 1_MG-2023 TaxID=3062624 RepID=UPI000C338E96|nr:Lrp/AsnC family transcriptional regulator [Psychrobium sp. 1_MG-2023]MDP2561085.1 Lrp/AsnC family transcriptional regulator [Psychrobium sp. 1_MG-2023]PKF58374.1 AsnC family transcriptional regulator [Alteromonadales bacterium alter-6D02]